MLFYAVFVPFQPVFFDFVGFSVDFCFFVVLCFVCFCLWLWFSTGFFCFSVICSFCAILCIFVWLCMFSVLLLCVFL